MLNKKRRTITKTTLRVTGLSFIVFIPVRIWSHTSYSPEEGIRHLRYPGYFGFSLAVFKVLGAVVLIIPGIPGRMKEWAYAGFAFDFVFAFLSYSAVEGLHGLAFFPLFALGFLIVSNIVYHKIRHKRKLSTANA